MLGSIRCSKVIAELKSWDDMGVPLLRKERTMATLNEAVLSTEFADLRKDLGELRTDLSAFRAETRTQFTYLRAILVFNIGLIATALWKLFDLSKDVTALGQASTAMLGLN
jgi:hypothetical protein